jgi:tRNA (guanine-N7-)-methyltransferase
MSSDSDHPHIRSFSGRRGHFTSGQRSAYDMLLPRFSVPYRAEPIVASTIFERDGPLVLEIGFGMGESTAAIALAQPERNFLGVEVYPAGVGSLLRQIDEAGLSNLRIIQHDAIDVLMHMILPASLAAVHVFFPDPWPKARHHKRRLIRPEVVALIASRLAPGGVLQANRCSRTPRARFGCPRRSPTRAASLNAPPTVRPPSSSVGVWPWVTGSGTWS